MKTTRKLSPNKTFSVMSAVAGLALTLLFLLCASTVQAQTLIDPTVNAVTSELTGYGRYAVNTVNGSGLTAGPSGILGAADSTADNNSANMWTTDGNWATPNDLNPAITYDLGGLCNLQTIRIWNYNEGGFNFISPTNVLLSTSTDGVNFTSNSIINLAEGGGTNGEPAQDFPLIAAGVRYVQLQILQTYDGCIFWFNITGNVNYNGINDNRALTGLAEVRFVGNLLTTPQPVISPVSGNYVGPVAVTISDFDANAVIYYSTDAWVTTNVYSGPVALPVSTIGLNFQTYAKDPNFTPSTVVSATYSTVPSPVWLNPNGGSWADTSAFSWSNSIPANGAGVNADFSKLTLPTNAIVTLDGNWTVGSLTFGDVGNTYNWELDSGTNSGNYLVLDGTNTPNINVVNQSVTMTVALRGSDAGTCLTKTGNGTLRLGLGTINDYRGVTDVRSGTLVVDGTLGDGNIPSHGTSDVAVDGGTLTGIGTIAGSLTVHSGGTFMPGTSDLTNGMTIGGYRMVLEGNTIMRIAVNANTPTNNQVSMIIQEPNPSGFVSYGGVLTVTNITSDGSLLTAGNMFPLFTGASNYFGAFSSYQLPALPAGLFWDVSGLYVNGSISVTANTPAPLFNPPGKTFVPPLAVAISCLDTSAVIYYSTNAWATANVYNGPLNVPTNVVIQAYAKDPSLSGSSTNSASYTASPVIEPVGVQFSSQLLDYDRYAFHLIDGSELYVGPSGILGGADSTVGPDSSENMWMTTGNNWSTPNDPDPYLIFDLGLVYNLQTTRIWNYNETGYGKFGCASIMLSTSVDGTNFTQFGIINPPEGGSASAEPAQDFATTVTRVRYVEMQVLTNWDGAIYWPSITGNSYFYGVTDNRGIAGLSEVRFVGTPALVIAQPVIRSTTLSGGNLILSGTGGTANAGYSVLTTTNLVTPLANWTLLSTGNFDGSGAFSITNAISSGSAKTFYTIRTP